MTDATEITNIVFSALSDRKGFDDWFDQIDEELQAEIKAEIAEAIAALRANIKNYPEKDISQPAGWIAVTERLPKPYDEVMVWPIPSNNSRTADINTIGVWRYGEYESGFGWNESVCQVTHWMPLPPPPAIGETMK